MDVMDNRIDVILNEKRNETKVTTKRNPQLNWNVQSKKYSA
jgi:hypothetical protein